MNVDVLGPIQQALYTTLTADATLTVDVTGVFDEVPEKQQFPYVVLGEATVSPGSYSRQGGFRIAGALDTYGSRTTVTLHVWSAYHGWAEGQTIAGHLVRLLDHQPLTVSDHHTVAVRHEQTVSMRDPDGDLRHLACRFSIETEHPA